MVRQTPRLFMPFPEIVEPQAGATPYRILDSNGKKLPTNGMTSMERRVLIVPLDAEHHSVALHELAHVRWSPMRLPKVHFDLRFVMAVEDARINLALALLDLGVHLLDSERTEVAFLAREDLARRDALGFVLRAIASLGTNAEDTVLAALIATENRQLAELVHTRLERVRRALEHGRSIRRAPVASFALVLRLAAELARELGREVGNLGYADALPTMAEFGDEACCFRGCDERAAPGKRRPGSDRRRTLGDLASGRLIVSQPHLPHASPRARAGRPGGARPSGEGDLLRFPHRWAIDQAIFRRVTRVSGGTVLIDTSGSMSLDAAAIDRILLAATGATLIAIYSGRQDHGELRIIARDDRRADPKDLVPYDKGNIVDEPALQWLAKQAEPRLWVSDGGVTGVGDAPADALKARCDEIVRRGRIRRVDNLEQAAAALARWRPRSGAERATRPESPVERLRKLL